MTKRNFLCGFLSAIILLTVAGTFLCSVSAVDETEAETSTAETVETEKLPLVTVDSKYDEAGAVTDAEELKTSDNDITKQSKIEVPQEMSVLAPLLNDKNRATKIKFSNGAEIKVSNDRNPIYSIYIIWDTPVYGWNLSYGGKSLQCGENGFIHEYIELETPTLEFTINIPDTSATICDIYTFTKGEKPSWVQDWQPPCQHADMLVLPARGNNEVMDFGGLLPYYAGETGAKVQVAYMVNQWLEYYRPHEILNALWTCGVEYYPVFGDFSDCEVRSYDDALLVYDKDAVTEYVVSLIRRFRPQIVVGQDLRGEGENAMNMLYAEATAKACEISADSSKYPESADEFGTWDVPKTYLHLYGNNSNGFVSEETQVAETSAPPVVSGSGEETLETGVKEYSGDIEYLVKPIVFDWRVSLENFDGKSAYDVAEEAFSCHKSQTTWKTMPESGINTTAVYGLYRTTVGYDRSDEADMLENADVVIVKIDDNGQAINPEEVIEHYKGKRRGSYTLFIISSVFAAIVIMFTLLRRLLFGK